MMYDDWVIVLSEKDDFYSYIYIYIYIKREREREREYFDILVLYISRQIE
jgi:hypothetical protein